MKRPRSGCKSTARAIDKRKHEAVKAIDIRRGDIWDLLTNTGLLRRSVRSVASGRVSYIDADGRFTQCDIGAFKRWAKSAFLHAADNWTDRDAEGRAIAQRGGGK